jgi:tetratricopeptide (TPR) repeat protein
LDQPDAAEADLSRAVSAAIASGHDELIAKAGISLVGILVNRQHRLREADHWQGIAAAGIEHLGGDVMLESELLITSSRGLTERGEPEAALAAASEGLALREQLLGPDHLDLVPALMVVSRVYYVQGELDKMEATYQRALGILEPHYGSDHPALTSALANLAVVHLLQGRTQLAVEILERVLILRTQQLGSDHISTIDVRSNLGIALVKLGKHEQAEVHLRHVQEVYEQRYGADNPDTGEAYVNLATAVELRDVELAIEYLNRARKIFEGDDSDQGRRLVAVLRQLSQHAEARGELEHSGELASRALELARTAYGDQHPKTLELMLDMASVELARGDVASARALIEPTLLELEGGEDSALIARAYFLLGQVMVASGEREAGVAKVQAGLAMLDEHAEQAENVVELRERITAWLSGR